MKPFLNTLNHPLTILENRDLWNSANPLEQDRAIKIIDRFLGPAYQWMGTDTYSCMDQQHRIATFCHDASSAELNLIPGGSFLMGTDGTNPDERPVHEVRIRPFLIGRHPLTQDCWDMIGGVDERHWSELELPINGISWHDAQSWLRRAGDQLRLPSEAEWEYACRAGSQSEYYWGEDMDPSFCWYGGNAFNGFQPHPPWEHEDKPNSFGLIDIAGNVFEWCEDEWFENYLQGPMDERPMVSSKPRGHRVIRGGAWNDHCDHCCSAFRFHAQPSDNHSDYGIRIARSIPNLKFNES